MLDYALTVSRSCEWNMPGTQIAMTPLYDRCTTTPTSGPSRWLQNAYDGRQASPPSYSTPSPPRTPCTSDRRRPGPIVWREYICSRFRSAVGRRKMVDDEHRLLVWGTRPPSSRGRRTCATCASTGIPSRRSSSGTDLSVRVLPLGLTV